MKTDRIAKFKQEHDLLATVAQHVELRPEGDLYRGLCPFHSEKTPSFTVQDRHYHCFGCGAHGDVLNFLCGVHGKSIKEILEESPQKQTPKMPVALPKK